MHGSVQIAKTQARNRAHTDDEKTPSCNTCINTNYVIMQDEDRPADLVIGMDTIVVIDDTILEKPGSPELAFTMLKTLRGRIHSVYTAVTLVYPHKGGSTVRCFVEETQVEFANISDQVLQACNKRPCFFS